MTADKLDSVREYFHFSKEIEEDSLFKKMITLSIILHFFVFIFFGLKATLFSSEPIELDPTIKVTMVGLPDKVTQLPEMNKPIEKTPPPEEKAPPVPLPPVPIAKPIPKPAPVVVHPKADIHKALDKIKEIEKEEKRKAALENIQKEVQAEEKKAERQAKVAQILKGNQVNNGSALHGLMQADLNDYASAVHNHLHEHWNLPEWLRSDTLKATIVVYLDSQGSVLKRIVRKSSGDERFDNFALQAVDESSPFPKPPEKLVGVLKNDGMALGFPQ